MLPASSRRLNGVERLSFSPGSATAAAGGGVKAAFPRAELTANLSRLSGGNGNIVAALLLSVAPPAVANDIGGKKAAVAAGDETVPVGRTKREGWRGLF